MLNNCDVCFVSEEQLYKLQCGRCNNCIICKDCFELLTEQKFITTCPLCRHILTVKYDMKINKQIYLLYYISSFIIFLLGCYILYLILSLNENLYIRIYLSILCVYRSVKSLIIVTRNRNIKQFNYTRDAINYILLLFTNFHILISINIINSFYYLKPFLILLMCFEAVDSFLLSINIITTKKFNDIIQNIIVQTLYDIIHSTRTFMLTSLVHTIGNIELLCERIHFACEVSFITTDIFKNLFREFIFKYGEIQISWYALIEQLFHLSFILCNVTIIPILIKSLSQHILKIIYILLLIHIFPFIIYIYYNIFVVNLPFYFRTLSYDQIKKFDILMYKNKYSYT